jgi:hypothetical protein
MISYREGKSSGLPGLRQEGTCLPADPPGSEEGLSHPMTWYPMAAWSPVARDPYRMVRFWGWGAVMDYGGTGNAEGKEQNKHCYFGQGRSHDRSPPVVWNCCLYRHEDEKKV